MKEKEIKLNRRKNIRTQQFLFFSVLKMNKSLPLAIITWEDIAVVNSSTQ